MFVFQENVIYVHYNGETKYPLTVADFVDSVSNKQYRDVILEKLGPHRAEIEELIKPINKPVISPKNFKGV
jgi:hypothetical protein